MEALRLIVLSDFSVHVNDDSSGLAKKFMAIVTTMGLSKGFFDLQLASLWIYCLE